MTDPTTPVPTRRAPDARQLDEQLVAPAKRGLRKFGLGAGALVAAVVALSGLGFASLGGLLMLLTAIPLVDGIGAFLLALGLTAMAFGGGGVALLRKADQSADGRELERRLRKLLTDEGETTDVDAARRLRVPVEAVRELADVWVKSGALVVDVDEHTGVERYVAGRRGNAELPELTAAERADMDAFEAALQDDADPNFTTRTVADAQAGAAKIRAEAPAEVEEPARR